METFIICTGIYILISILSYWLSFIICCQIYKKRRQQLKMTFEEFLHTSKIQTMLMLLPVFWPLGVIVVIVFWLNSIIEKKIKKIYGL